MRYQTELERLTTLDADSITRACTSKDEVIALIDRAVDECIQYDELADEHLTVGAEEHAAFCRQEAAAWRATAALLRVMATNPGTDRRSRGAA